VKANLSWTLEPGVLIGVAIVGGVYVARWREVRIGNSARPAADAPVWAPVLLHRLAARRADRARCRRSTRSPISCSSCT